MAAPISDEKMSRLAKQIIFFCVKNTAGYHLGPVASSASDGASLSAAKRSCEEGNTNVSMGSHHHQVAILVLDDKLDCFGQLENFFA